MSEAVGIIGLGLLGSAIARRLQQARYEVHGFDPRPAADLPVRLHDSAANVATACPTVVFSLPTSDVVRRVVDDVGDCWHAGHLVVDTTTGDPADVERTAAALARYGARYVESCVAGSSVQILEGKAALFLAGSPETLKELHGLFRALSHSPLVIGEVVGAASRFKLVHNLALGLHRAVLAEALQFAEALGFDAQESLALLQQTPAASEVMRQKGKRLAAHDYANPQARLTQHLKDVRLILAEAERSGARVPLSSLHRQLLEQAEALGFGDADNSAIMEAFNR